MRSALSGVLVPRVPRPAASRLVETGERAAVVRKVRPAQARHWDQMDLVPHRVNWAPDLGILAVVGAEAETLLLYFRIW